MGSMDKFLLEMEDGFTPVAQAAMTDSGDRKKFTSGAGVRFSLCHKDENGVDRRPVVRPDGVRTGFLLTPGTGNDAVNVAAGTCYQAFAPVSVAAGPLTATRGATTNTHIINSITVDSTGALAVVAGTASTVFSATRGAAGGPPLIPVGSIEIGQVRLTSITAAPVTSDEIIYSPEFSHAPDYTLLPYEGAVQFAAALPAIHTGNAARRVYVKYSAPSLVDITGATGKVKPVTLPQKVATALFFSGAKSAVTRGDFKNGSFDYEESELYGNVLNRADNTVRLFRYMQDSSADRAVLFYALLTLEPDFAPGTIPVGKATVEGLWEPKVEAV